MTEKFLNEQFFGCFRWIQNFDIFPKPVLQVTKAMLKN